MTMNFGTASFRHVVDVDGQLHGIEQSCVDVGALLGLAGHRSGRRLYREVGDAMVEVEPGKPVRLNEDEVAFFRSVPWPQTRELLLAA